MLPSNHTGLSQPPFQSCEPFSKRRCLHQPWNCKHKIGNLNQDVFKKKSEGQGKMLLTSKEETGRILYVYKLKISNGLTNLVSAISLRSFFLSLSKLAAFVLASSLAFLASALWDSISLTSDSLSRLWRSSTLIMTRYGTININLFFFRSETFWSP